MSKRCCMVDEIMRFLLEEGCIQGLPHSLEEESAVFVRNGIEKIVAQQTEDYNKLRASSEQMTKEQAEQWAREMCEKGTGKARMQYYNKFGIGKIAEDLWDDNVFTFGMEYGILIAVAFVFGELPDKNSIRQNEPLDGKHENIQSDNRSHPNRLSC